MTVKEMRVYSSARLMASDADLCRMHGLAPEALEAFRPLIDRARAEALVELKYTRALKTAEKPKAQ